MLDPYFPLVGVELYPLQLYGIKRNVKPLTPSQFIFRQANKKEHYFWDPRSY